MQQKSIHNIIRVLMAALVAAVMGVSGCCDSVPLKLSRMSDFLSGVWEIGVEVELDSLVTFHFSGDLGGWSDIPALSMDAIGPDISLATYETQELLYDMDFDGKKESVRLLVARGSSVPGGQVIFASWKGDAFTLDKSYCYLG